MLIHEIRLQNLLSFGPDTPPLELRPLNVLIGPNGSGKSNLVEALGLLRAAPDSVATPIREGGGIQEWLWKGAENPVATVEVAVDYVEPWHGTLRYVLRFGELGQRFCLEEERIESTPGDLDEPLVHARYEPKRGVLEVGDESKPLASDRGGLDTSILAQLKDPDRYPELAFLTERLTAIRIYRDWSFGRDTPTRRPQRADELNDFLAENCSNLGLVLNRLRGESSSKTRLLEMLDSLYPGISDADVHVEGGTVQVFFQEGNLRIPATRLSDGTLRYLCLLVILCHPKPPPVICLEEPELGLHPDALPSVAELLKDASLRTQLIVTTHSDVLVDALSESPEDVVVCEREGDSTVLRRLDAERLAVWLEKYALGQLWRSGEIGGNRW